MKNLSKTGKKVIVIAVLWGIVLAISGMIKGNHALTAPEPGELQQIVMKEKLSNLSLDCWISKQRSDYLLLEFADSKKCSTDYVNVNTYTCYNEKSLNNILWIRNAFKKLNRQLIVFGTTPEKSINAASTLKKYGYDVRMLDRNGSMASNKLEAQPNNSVSKAIQQTEINSSCIVNTCISNMIETEIPEKKEG